MKQLIKPLLLHHSYVMKTQILNNAHILGLNNMAANVLIFPGMTRQGVLRVFRVALAGIFLSKAGFVGIRIRVSPIYYER